MEAGWTETWIFLAAGRPYVDLADGLSRVFSEARFAVLRSGPEPLKEFTEACARFDLTARAPIIVGVAEKADFLAKAFFDFFAIRPPEAMILISPSVRPIFLNNLTCPYLILHGRKDPVLEFVPYPRFEEAVHHHQMRYGDPTTLALIHGVGRDLGGKKLSPLAKDQILNWLSKVIQPERKTARAA